MASDALKVRKTEQIRLLASTVRQEIVDGVQALGEATIAQLAEMLGRPADGLYYHLRALEKAGLIGITRVRGPHGRMEAVYRRLSRTVRLSYNPSDRANREAVIATVSTMLRTTSRQFVAGFDTDHPVTEGPRRNLWAATGKAWLTERDLEIVNATLERLGRMISRPRKSNAARLHAITFVIAPVREKPARRGSGTSPESAESDARTRRRKAKR